MSYFEAAIITIFGVILPTGDVGSDYWVAGALFLTIILHHTQNGGLSAG